MAYRKSRFTLGLSVFWICISILEIDVTRMRIIFERNHGVTEWQSKAFLVFWIITLIVSLYSCWVSHKARKENG